MNKLDWRIFSAALKLADPSVSFEWGTKYLYLVPAEVTRERWDAYTLVCGAYKVPYRAQQPAYRFFVTVHYRYKDFVQAASIFDHMPWRKSVERPELSNRFKLIQHGVANLAEYDDLCRLRSMGHASRWRRLSELEHDPFVLKWKNS